MKLPKGPFRLFSATSFLVGGLAWMAHVQLSGGTCGPTSQLATTGATSQIAHAPTISVATITWELHHRQSPLSTADASFVWQEARAYQIDDAFALADWAAESQDGREAVPGTDNIGNITASVGVSWAGHVFAVYPTWQAGIAAWFSLIDRLYLKGGHASDLVTFALYYVDGLTPQEASDAELQQLTSGYVQTLLSIIAELQAHERQSDPGGPPGGGGSTPASLTTLAALLPANVSPAWAGSRVVEAAAAITIQTACAAGMGSITPMVSAALVLAAHLAPDQNGSFDRWSPGIPAGVLSQNGVVWCTDYVASVYEQASHQTFGAYPNATDWWAGTPSQHPGFVRVPAGPDSFPLPGDIIVLQDGAAGHVAVALGVKLPVGATPGLVIVAQAHATHAVEVWSLLPDGTLKPPWEYPTHVPGYLRIPALSGSASARVQPIIQAEVSAGYDSLAQHAAFWNADCAAAVLTEVLRAWGVNTLTLGHAIDVLAGHQPDPYLTPQAGLTSQAAFDWFARQYHFGALVQQGRSLTLAALLSMTRQGIPVIVGVRDTTGAYYPAFAVGHFLVVTGGDASHLQIIDSSLYRIQALSTTVFSALWTGETVVITPE